MTNWEYTVADLTRIAKDLSELNRLGAEGWEAVAGDYALEGYRSVADVVDAQSLAKVREHKQEMKAAAKAAK